MSANDLDYNSPILTSQGSQKAISITKTVENTRDPKEGLNDLDPRLWQTLQLT